MRFLRAIRDRLFDSLLTTSEYVDLIEDDLEDLHKENDALWNRMVALEVERNSHDGTNECAGCDSSIARTLEDLDIDSLIPGGIHKLVNSYLGTGTE
jgi:hypothetical protein